MSLTFFPSGAGTRRQFLATSAVASLAWSHPTLASANQDQPKPPVIDTHLHCFAGNQDPRFPYHERAPYRPDQSATPEHLLKCMDQAGVDFAVVVHPEPYQDDHRYLEHCLKVGAGRLKGTCLLFSDRPGSMEKLPDLARKLPLIAARVHAYAPDRLPPFGKPELRRLWQLATEAGLAMQLHFEPRYASGFEPLIKEFHDTTVIIDHLGRPFQGTPREHAVVVGWSKYPNTILKVSSLPSTRSYPHRDVAPVVHQLADAYGADRLIYGGGYGADATGDSYRAYRERVAQLLDGFSDAQRAQVLGGNAARLFSFSS